MQIEKEGVQLSFTDDLRDCRKFEIVDKNLPELISSCCKAVEYKVNRQRSVAVLYTDDEQVQFEIKNKIPFTLVSKY